MSCRVSTTSLIPGACVVGNRGLGVLGSVIRATTGVGESGAGYLYNDLTGADDAKEIRGLIVSPPAAGSFFAWEDGTFELIGAPDGTYALTYRLFADGADLGIATSTFAIGAAAPVNASASIVGVVSGAASATVDARPATQVSAVVIGTVTGSVAAQANVTNPAAAVVAILGVVTGSVDVRATLEAPITQVTAAIVGAITGVVAAQASGSAPQSLGQSSVGTTATLTLWAAKDPREEFWISFTFPGEVSDVVMTVDTYSKFGATDADPEGIFAGPQVVQGSTVTRFVHGGVDLVDYYIDCVATVAGDRMVAASMLPVREK